MKKKRILKNLKLFRGMNIAEQMYYNITAFLKDDTYCQSLSYAVEKQIADYNLPLKFSSYAVVSVNSFCDSVAEVNILLIDCLNKYKAIDCETVYITTEHLLALYPDGFYTKDEIDKKKKFILANRLSGWNKIFRETL